MKKLILSSILFSVIFRVGAQFDSAEAVNVHASRYAFAPSAFAVPRGTIYYQSYDFLMHDVQLGVTDNFSMGIGLGIPMLAYITPKYSFRIADKWRMAFGDIAFSSMFTSENESSLRGNIAYTSITKGTAANNITFSAGFLTHNLSKPYNLPVFNTSGMLGITKNVYMVLELWGGTAKSVWNYTKSTWQRDANGKIITSGPYNAEINVTNEKFSSNIILYMSNLQFRVIGNGENTSSWAFGLTALGQSGKKLNYRNEYEGKNWSTGEFRYEEHTIGAQSGFLVLPSVTYVRKFGDLSKRDIKL